MKKTGLFIWFVCIITACFAQERITLESQKLKDRIYNPEWIPQIKGKLLHYTPEEGDSLRVEYYLLLPSKTRGVTKFAEINPDGTFTLELETGLPYQQMWFSIGDYYYGEIFANKDLTIIADLEKLKKESVSFYGDGIKFEGTDADIVEYVNTFYTFERDRKSEFQKKIQAATYDREISSDEKVIKLREAYKGLEKIEEEYAQKFPSEHRWILENDRLSDMYGETFVCYWVGKEYKGKKFVEEALAHQPLRISNGASSYYNYLSTLLSSPTLDEMIAITETVLLENASDKEELEEIKLFLGAYKKKMRKEEYDKDIYKDGKKYFSKFQEATKMARNDLMIKKLVSIEGNKGDLVKMYGGPEGILEREKYLANILPTMKMEWSKNYMTKEWEAKKKRVAEINATLQSATENDAPKALGESIVKMDNGANLYMANQKNIETLMADIKSEYKDKAVIIDVWTTWCMPCLHDMKNSVEVKKELKKLPLEIVYICVESGGSNTKDWKKLTAELSLSGDHIFLKKPLASDIMEYFGLRGYPSYIFIDKQGNYDLNLVKRISSLDVDMIKHRIEGK